MANEVRLEGFKEFKDKLNQLPKKVNGNLSAFVSDAGKKWVQLAKNSAPIDNGKLAGGITEKTTGLVSEVTVNAKYAQFIEWGTKRRKVVPPGLTAYANSLQYQKTGDYYDFLNAILDWVKRKGVGATYSVATRRKKRQSKDEYLSIAQAIANSIIRHGVNPHPFFFQHKDVVFNELMQNAKRYLETQQ